jgi:hypothetical protein
LISIALALETVADIYYEEKKTATRDVLQLVARLAAEMSMDPAPLIDKMSKA